MKSLRRALELGGLFVLVMALVISLSPKGSDYPGGEFAWDFWPWFLEAAFWLGMFAGMLWGASQRLGMALAATLPWQEPRSDREATGRFFGQWAACASLLGFFLWLAYQLALAADMTEVAAVLAAFTPLETACWLAAGLFAAITVAHRSRRPVKEGSRHEAT
ncbi:MAG: hypothetical protein CVU18_09580 [Betaproteobacteria bacterium HGW-Betaproteobacteria-12]|nr:MAG: hypothetical protein CVU18_09580 [Betaproteobacteria bacterium HGW-Betaproteobacteria-12]